MYYQFISFLFWQQYRRAKFPSIVVPVGTKHLISESLVILSCHIISLSCSLFVVGPFCKPAMVCSVFYCIPRFRQHFMAVRSGCYQEILRVQPSLYWGTSARFTPITYTCKFKTLYWQSILLNMLTIIKLLLFVGGHSSWVAKIFLVHKEVIVLVANLG